MRIGIIKKRAFITAFVARRLCLVVTISIIQGQGGLAIFSLLMRPLWRNSTTRLMGWYGLRCIVASVQRIWGICSLMGLRLRGCDIVLILPACSLERLMRQ
jgi:hypothetical protein